MDKTISRRIADFATSVQYSDIPDVVIAAGKRFLYDSIGCGLGGVETEDCNIARKALLALGGKPECTVIGTGERTDAVDRGIDWLIATQREDGGWDEPAYTGTGFPGDFYIQYHLYRIVFPLMALGRYASAAS